LVYIGLHNRSELLYQFGTAVGTLIVDNHAAIFQIVYQMFVALWLLIDTPADQVAIMGPGCGGSAIVGDWRPTAKVDMDITLRGQNRLADYGLRTADIEVDDQP